jgi:hypothetical protein
MVRFVLSSFLPPLSSLLHLHEPQDPRNRAGTAEEELLKVWVTWAPWSAVLKGEDVAKRVIAASGTGTGVILGDADQLCELYHILVADGVRVTVQVS